MSQAATAALSPSDSESKRHPRGLYVLFTTEMWERFSYYGMRALLVLYLTKHLEMTRENALQIYATYTSLVYLTPLVGGYLADRYLGQRKAILIGGLVMALGHFAMAFEPLLNIALGLLIIGNGFFKPNISTLVGSLYGEHDARRDGAFTIFYMGINLGAFFSPLVCGTLGEHPSLGWHYGFGAAGIGMVFGLGVFMWGQKLLGKAGFPPGRTVDESTRLTPRDWMHITIYVVGASLFVLFALWVWPLLHPAWSPGGLEGVALLVYRFVIAGALAAGLVYLPRFFKKPGETDAKAAEPMTREEWQRMAVVLIVTSFGVLFWMGFEQAGGTMTLFTDQQTDLSFLGFELRASWFQAVNPFLIFILAPLFSMMWTAIDRSRFPIPSIAKLGIGLILLGLGFVVMYAADQHAIAVGKVSPLWIAGVYFIHTIGELCLSPVGLSLVTKLAPTRVVSLMMAVWLTSSAVANYLAGTLEARLHGTSINLWAFLVVTSVVPGVVLIAITPLLKKMSHGRG